MTWTKVAENNIMVILRNLVCTCLADVVDISRVIPSSTAL